MKISRRKLRETIFLLLFRIEFNTAEELREQVDWFFDGNEQYSPESSQAIRDKLEDILSRLPEIDSVIGEICEGWSINRLGKAELALLRLAVYEIKMDDNVPTGVAINEAVELAKRFGTDASGPFVNGLLGRIARDMEQEAPSEDE